MGDLIDQLARAMARGTSRKDFLKLVGASIAGLVLSEARPVEAGVGRTKGKKKSKQPSCDPPCTGDSPDCVNGKCTCIAGGNCPGCCLDLGFGGTPSCINDPENNCGINGQPCKLCTTGTECVNGQCACTSKSCRDGCCTPEPGLGGACVQDVTDRACGALGSKCTDCTLVRKVCGSPSLQAPRTCVCKRAGSGPAAEADLCCEDGHAECGAKCCNPGESCQPCAGRDSICCPSGQLCVNGICLGAPPAPCTTLGGSCTPTAVDCAHYGSGACDTGTCWDFGMAPSPGDPNPLSGCCPQEQFSRGANGIRPGLCCIKPLVPFPDPSIGAACGPP